MKKQVIAMGFVLTIGLGAFAATLPSTPAEDAQHCATCTGATPCKACKSCKYCKFCAKDKGKCGTCEPKN